MPAEPLTGPAEHGSAPGHSGPERIRALAHPLRLEILDLLDTRGEATATECAAATGQTVANCSFHLRTLAKYGFVEEAARRGRERPWRAVPGGYDLRPDVDSSEAVRASDELSLLTVEREHARLRTFYSGPRPEPVLRRAASIMTETVWATPAELAALADQVAALVAPLAERSAEDRPARALPARALVAITPEPRSDDGAAQSS